MSFFGVILLIFFACYPAYSQQNTERDFICNRASTVSESVLRRARKLSIVKNNAQFIREQMQKYGFSDFDAIAYVLYKEYHDSGPLDSMQNDRARRGMLKHGNSNLTMISPDLARGISDMENDYDVEYLENIYKEDLLLLSLGEKPANRNASSGLLGGGIDVWYFSTLGLAQINLYIAFIMIKEGMILNEDLVYNVYNSGMDNNTIDLHRLAWYLADEQSNIEFLIAYLKWAYEVYDGLACLDLTGKLDMVWELHTMGWFEYYAQNRHSECDCKND